jgi:ferredoxin
VNDILRMESYFANYNEEKIAMQRYAVIDDARKPLPCRTCPGYCEKHCPYGLSVKERLINAHQLLTFA